MIEREWKEEYNIGCDYVDNAHRKLFRILWKVMDLLSERDYEKHKHACAEAIKFLYNYTATHFAEEEGFMRKLNYAGYDEHKKIHDDIKNVIVPAHDKKMQDSDYAKDEVREFLGFFTGWLTGHILVEDKAITDDLFEKIKNSDISPTEKIEKEMELFIKEISDCPLSLESTEYAGTVFEDALYYEISYGKINILFMSQKSLIKRIVSDMIEKSVDEVDKAVLVSYIQMLQNIGKIVYHSIIKDKYKKPDTHKLLNAEDVKKSLDKTDILNYLRWSSTDGELEIFIYR